MVQALLRLGKEATEADFEKIVLDATRQVDDARQRSAALLNNHRYIQHLIKEAEAERAGGHPAWPEAQ